MGAAVQGPQEGGWQGWALGRITPAPSPHGRPDRQIQNSHGSLFYFCSAMCQGCVAKNTLARRAARLERCSQFPPCAFPGQSGWGWGFRAPPWVGGPLKSPWRVTPTPSAGLGGGPLGLRAGSWQRPCALGLPVAQSLRDRPPWLSCRCQQPPSLPSNNSVSTIVASKYPGPWNLKRSA